MGKPSQPDVKICDVEGFPWVPGCKRAVAFLKDPQDKFVNGLDVFSEIDQDIKRGLNTGIQQWIQFRNAPKRHHGWDQNEHGGAFTKCYVFKHTGKKARMYGYLVHPKKDHRAILCVLIHYDTKTEDEADVTMLGKLNGAGNKVSVQEAVDVYWNGQLAKEDFHDQKKKQ